MTAPEPTAVDSAPQAADPRDIVGRRDAVSHRDVFIAAVVLTVVVLLTVGVTVNVLIFTGHADLASHVLGSLGSTAVLLAFCYAVFGRRK